jgi:methionyl aminopeptidase
LEDGDIVNVDVTLYVDGFHGDLNETFLVGHVDEKYKKLIQVTKTCLERAIDIVRPGVQYKEIGNVIQKIASQNGFSVVKSYCGHGVHKYGRVLHLFSLLACVFIFRVFHGPPTVPHYANNKAVGVMVQGHTFTIEPMICEGSPADTHWPDDWTCLTKDGKRSAQYEHTLLVTERGCDILTL